MSVAADLAAVQKRISCAAKRAGRHPDEITVVAVTKHRSAAVVQEGIHCGLRNIGENYAQEMVRKSELLSHADLRWHFIGHLQRNKVKFVVGRSWLIHCVDSFSLAQAIDRHAKGRGITQRVLVWLNVADESSKSGVSLEAAPNLVGQIADLDHIQCEGLAAMPPPVADPELNRVWFRKVAALRDALATATCPLPILSLGTSNDFEVAIEEGATLVRLGTVLFGPRVANSLV